MLKRVYNTILVGNNSDSRGFKAKRNVYWGLAFKIGVVIINLALVSISLQYVDKTSYGLWLTISSIINWVTFFDIGLGGGLRNKLAEALATQNVNLGKGLISTTYVALISIVSVIIVLFFILNTIIPWDVVFNAPQSMSDEVELVVIAAFVLFCVRLIFQTISSILAACQNTGKVAFINFMISLVSLLGIALLASISQGSLLSLTLVLSTSPVVVYLLASIYYFRNDLRSLIPKINYADLIHLKSLMYLSSQFFIIQIVSMVVYNSSNILISQFFGPSSVTPYNITLRLFSTASLSFFIILGQLIPSFTDAFVKNDFLWIKKVIKKIYFVFGLMVSGIVVLYFLAPIVIRLWIGDSVDVPNTIIILVCIYTILQMWNGIFGTFLNSVGKVRLQLYIVFFDLVMFFCAVYIFVVILGYGIEGIIIASIIPLIIGAVWTHYQFKLIISAKAKGIWNK